MENNNPLEIDDILSRITTLFSSAADRRSIAVVDRQFRDQTTDSRAMLADAMMRGAMERFLLTKFRPITSMNQKIREVVPPFWILATAMSNHATAKERRESASAGAGDRYLRLMDSLTPTHYVPNITNDAMDTPEYRRRQAEGYFYVQYSYSPNKTLEQYFQEITNKVHAGNPIDVGRFFDDTVEQTAPELLNLTFTRGELDNYGW